MNEVSILNDVFKTYASFRTYSDFGTVDTVPPIGKTQTEFKTYFAQPRKARFEWRRWHPYFGTAQPPNDAIIWSDGASSHKWFLGKEVTVETFPLALAAATGVSSMASLMIMALLYPDSLGAAGTLRQLHNVQVMNREVLAGRHCVHIVGDIRSSGDLEAWVSEDDFIVRRLKKHMRLTVSDIKRMDIEANTVLRRLGKDVALHESPEEDREYYHEYNYLHVAINTALPDSLFISRAG